MINSRLKLENVNWDFLLQLSLTELTASVTKRPDLCWLLRCFRLRQSTLEMRDRKTTRSRIYTDFSVNWDRHTADLILPLPRWYLPQEQQNFPMNVFQTCYAVIINYHKATLCRKNNTLKLFAAFSATVVDLQCEVLHVYASFIFKRQFKTAHLLILA